MRSSQLIACGFMALACGVDPKIPLTRIYVSDGHTQREVMAEHRPQLDGALRALLSSCSSNSSVWAGTLDNWHAAEAAPAIIAVYARATRIRTMDGEVEVDSILFPLAAPDHVLSRRGTSVYAFAKWRPELEAALICDPHLDLQRYARIREFCDIMGAS